MRPSLARVRLALGLSLGVVPAAAHAQSSGAVPATGTVLQAITITGTDLSFGNMTASQARTVAPTAADAGRFAITLAPNTTVTVAYVLPTSLGAGIAIGGWQGLYGVVNNAAGAAALPIGGTTGSFSTASSTGEMYVWLGATLTTTAAAPGTYSAPISFTVTYN